MWNKSLEVLMKNGNRKRDRFRKDLGRAYGRVLRKETGPVGGLIDGQAYSERAGTLGNLRKMEIVGQLAGSLAQYFNNILTLIIGYGSYLQVKLDEKDPLRPYVHQILLSSERAAILTRGLLAFTRKQVINPKPVGINDIIQRAGKLIRRIIGEGIDFRTSLSRTELTVFADAVQLEQVMMNLATNARDAMPGGGTLTVMTKILELGQARTDNGENAWKCAMISVSDTGSGMDEEVRERMFEPFFTTKEPAKATGLGLSIVYGIVKQHNGSINVTSDPGRGTKLSIYLPLLDTMVGQNRIGRTGPSVSTFEDARGF